MKFRKNIILVLSLMLLTFFTRNVECSDLFTDLLLRSDTTNGSTIFEDLSSENHSIIVSGNPYHSTDYAKFGSSSIYFGENDSLTIGSPEDWNFRTDLYTIDFWMLQTTNNEGCFFFRTVGGYADFRVQYENQDLRFLVENATDNAYLVDIRTSGISIKDGNWHHIAFVRSTSGTKIYVDGIAEASTTVNYDVNFTAPFLVGVFVGYIDEFRVSRGIARWESNFTPPAAPYEVCNYYYEVDGFKGSTQKAVSVPFNISNYSNNGIEGLDITLEFDPAVLNPQGITLTGGILDSNYNQTYNTSIPGKIIVSVSAESEPFVLSSGTACFVIFDVLASYDSKITITEVDINESHVCGNSEILDFSYDYSPSLPADSPIDNKNYITDINTPISITFTVNDSDTPLSDLIITANSSNESIIPSDNILFSNQGDHFEMTITPGQDQSTPYIPINIIVSDGSSELTTQINLQVNSFYHLAGEIDYYTGVNNNVGNVRLFLSGEKNYTVTSNEDGKYTFYNLEPGNYTLTAIKEDELGALNANNSTRIRRFKVKDINFDCYQKLAGDVTLNGTVGALDASRLAIGSAKLDANLNACMQNESCIHWIFVSPVTNSCDNWPPIPGVLDIPVNINSNISNMKLIGIRLGDVTGNWKSFNFIPNGAGNALYFDGIDDYVDVENGITLTTNSFSIEFWAKRLSTDSDDFIIGQGFQVDNQYLSIGFDASNSFKFGFWNDDLLTDETFTDNEWHHWAVTFTQGSRLRMIYKDGLLVKSDFASSDYIGGGNMTIGKAYPNSNFHGQIDELRIWSTARTINEIADNMNKKLTGSDRDLIACYNFDQYTGTTLRDIVKFSKIDYGSNFIADQESPSHVMESSIFNDSLDLYNYNNSSGYGLVNMNELFDLTQDEKYRLSIKVNKVLSGTPSMQMYIAYGGSHNSSITTSHVSASPAVSGQTYESIFDAPETRSDYFLHFREWAVANAEVTINLEENVTPGNAKNGTLKNMDIPESWVNSDLNIDE